MCNGQANSRYLRFQYNKSSPETDNWSRDQIIGTVYGHALFDVSLPLRFCLNTATYKYCCRGSYCPGCPIELSFTFAEQKSLIHAGLKLDCEEHNFNTTIGTLLQEGIYSIKVSHKKLNHT